MNNELIKVLRSVLIQELEPINKRLDKIELNGEGANKRLDAIEKNLVEHNNRYEVIEQDVKDLKTGQERFQKYIIQSLGEYTEKIAEHVDIKTEALNKRVFALESEIQRLTRQ